MKIHRDKRTGWTNLCLCKHEGVKINSTIAPLNLPHSDIDALSYFLL